MCTQHDDEDDASNTEEADALLAEDAATGTAAAESALAMCAVPSRQEKAELPQSKKKSRATFVEPFAESPTKAAAVKLDPASRRQSVRPGPSMAA